MTWNSHEIWCGSWPNRRQFVNEMTWDFHENPCHIFYRAHTTHHASLTTTKWGGIFPGKFPLHSIKYKDQTNIRLSFKKCDTDFLMSFWRQFSQEWHQIRRKFHHFPSKFHDLPLSKIHVMFEHGNQIKPG